MYGYARGQSYQSGGTRSHVRELARVAVGAFAVRGEMPTRCCFAGGLESFLPHVVLAFLFLPSQALVLFARVSA